MVALFVDGLRYGAKSSANTTVQREAIGSRPDGSETEAS
jgi:hypothetical protein